MSTNTKKSFSIKTNSYEKSNTLFNPGHINRLSSAKQSIILVNEAFVEQSGEKQTTQEYNVQPATIRHPT